MRETSVFLMNTRKRQKLYDLFCRQATKDYGLTRNELDVLLFLANNQGYDTARDIVELRGLTKSHVCKSVDSLIRRGYLRGEQDKRDRRLIHLELTEEAGAAARAGQAAQRRFKEVLYRGLSGEERTAVERISRKMAENVEREIENLK